MTGGLVGSSESQGHGGLIKSPLIKSFFAGTLSGTVSTILFQPLDVIKTRLQKTSNLGSKLSIRAVLVNVLEKDKIRGLWNGLFPSMCRTVPGAGLYFTCLHWVRSSFGSSNPHALETFVIGGVSRSFAGFMVLPFTVMKTRYESGEFHYNGLRHAIKSTYAKEGVRGLYSGLAPTLIRDVPYSGLYLMFYTKLKVFTSDYAKDYNILFNFCNGALAACLSSLITQPVDVIKTNVQLYPSKYGQLKNVVVHIYHERGLLGFLRGLLPRTVRRTLMSAMSWSVYEGIMKAYHIKT